MNRLNTFHQTPWELNNIHHCDFLITSRSHYYGSVFKHLDEREKNGYLRLETDMTFVDGSQATGLVYIATEDNEAYLGEASELEIARQICAAQGASGANSDYLLELAVALRELELEDQHVFEIETHILRILDS